MKKGIHPENYRQVIFHDNSSGAEFIIGSTIATTETKKLKGKEYPYVTVEISSASHPFYTGKDTVIDTAGRVEKFKARQATAKKTTKKSLGHSTTAGKA
ncbi:MAG TPA: type B 50S ribosomal protein L31 [Candidatus Paceibacterota bacterium]